MYCTCVGSSHTHLRTCTSWYCLLRLGCRGRGLLNLKVKPALSRPRLPPLPIYSEVLSVLYCTVLYCTVLYCLYLAVLYYTVLYCTVLYCAVLYCTVLYYTVLYCVVLYCTVLYCTILYCTVLYCTNPTNTVCLARLQEFDPCSSRVPEVALEAPAYTAGEVCTGSSLHLSLFFLSFFVCSLSFFVCSYRCGDTASRGGSQHAR